MVQQITFSPKQCFSSRKRRRTVALILPRGPQEIVLRDPIKSVTRPTIGPNLTVCFADLYPKPLIIR